MTVPSRPRTLAANQARQQGTRLKLDQIEKTLRQMRREHTPVTYPAVARRAGVSRTFLYQNQDARKLMAKAITAADDGRRGVQARQDEQAEAAWRQRALNAEDALKAAYSEIGTQRQRIAVLMGQVRDLQAEYTAGTAQRVATENTTLKQRVRQLADEKQAMEEKLQAARSNNRFLDKRVAQLEAELAAPRGPQETT
jgi:predicted  nucleic acid-binding Zn-ribbon protein